MMKVTQQQALKIKAVELATKAVKDKPLTMEAFKAAYEEIYKFLTTK